MANIMVPKKLQNERKCLFCTCMFLPEKPEQVYCSECTRLGLKVKDGEKRPKEEFKVLSTDKKTFKSKPCSKCEKVFEPVSAANRYCPDCLAEYETMIAKDQTNTKETKNDDRQ